MDGEKSHLFVICSQVCLKWRHFTDLLRAETFFVHHHDVSPQVVLERCLMFAEWTGVGVTKSVHGQVLPHLTQNPPLLST